MNKKIKSNRMSFYISDDSISIVENFREACGDKNTSKVIIQLIKEYMDKESNGKK